MIGMLVVRRHAPGAFPQNTVDLIKTFAAQSAVAIENARLFQNVEASLEDLRTAQDRLVQTEKLASLGQLTAGIAHEIKNPLNFVNNFSAVSVELIDELREALGGAHLDNKLRAEISEIADTLQGNLDKVVQHGKRADSIVTCCYIPPPESGWQPFGLADLESPQYAMAHDRGLDWGDSKRRYAPKCSPSCGGSG